jgi:hypothetical protein
MKTLKQQSSLNIPVTISIEGIRENKKKSIPKDNTINQRSSILIDMISLNNQLM